MHLSSISLYQFNNYESAKIQWSPVMNVIVGDNGMGKTNIVDAIYFLCLTKSYFSSLDKYSIMEGRDRFRIEGRFDVDTHPEIVEVKVVPGKSKEVLFSGKKQKKLTDYIGRLPCVIIAPDDIHNLISGSTERRNFLNNIIVQTDNLYLKHLLQHNRSLKQRNALLKQFQEQHYYDAVLLESVSTPMYDSAQYIYSKRKEVSDVLRPMLVDHYGQLSDGKEACDINYKSSLSEASLQDIFAQNLEKDRMLCRTSSGIHKDDLLFTLKDKSLKNYASQGQLKSYIIALKLAQYDYIGSLYGSMPLLILDDLYDKLDTNRVEALLAMVSKRGGQVFITDTGRDRIKILLEKLGMDYSQFLVDNGTIKEYNV